MVNARVLLIGGGVHTEDQSRDVAVEGLEAVGRHRHGRAQARVEVRVAARGELCARGAGWESITNPL